MTNAIVIAAVVIIIGAAVRYIIKAKKRGGCIGCSAGSACSGNCGCCKECK